MSHLSDVQVQTQISYIYYSLATTNAVGSIFRSNLNNQYTRARFRHAAVTAGARKRPYFVSVLRSSLHRASTSLHTAVVQAHRHTSTHPGSSRAHAENTQENARHCAHTHSLLLPHYNCCCYRIHLSTLAAVARATNVSYNPQMNQHRKSGFIYGRMPKKFTVVENTKPGDALLRRSSSDRLLIFQNEHALNIVAEDIVLGKQQE